jgi:hypothetical protein
VITAPPEPASPPSVTVFGVAPDTAALDHLVRLLGETPTADDRHDGTHHAAKRWLAGPEVVDERFAYLHSEYFRSVLPAADLIALLNAGRRRGEERELDFTPWGGAYNRVAADATAFPHRDARFLLKQTATVAAGNPPGDWLDLSYALTHPHGTGGAYPNFPEPGLPDDAYYLGNAERRRRIRATYDPEALFGSDPGSGREVS